MKERILYKLNSFFIILIFGAAIFIPFSIGIIKKDNEISELEKRKLLQFPETPKTIGDIKAFPQLFDQYYSDQFGLRDWFTKYYKLAKYSIGDSPSKDVTIGKNGWLFLGSIKKDYSNYDDPIGDARHVNLYSQQELKRFAKHMIGLKDWLNDQGIKYVFVIAPNKHTIYFDQLPDYISKVNNKSATDQLIEYLEKHTDISIVDLREQLIKAKDRHQLFYKKDTHWNHYAANIAQYEIMAEIEKIFPDQIQPDLQELVDATRSNGDLENFIGINTIEEYDPQPAFKQTCTPIKNPLDAKQRAVFTMLCEDQKLTSIIFRDSFFYILQPYFSRKFKHSTYLWERLNYSSLTKHIQLKKPDIVIEELVERNLPYVPDEHFYNNYLSKKKFDNSNELIFSKDETQLKFNEMLNNIDDDTGSLQLRVTGMDPIIYFPWLPIEPNNEYVLHINMSSSVGSTLQVFYSDSSHMGNPFS